MKLYKDIAICGYPSGRISLVLYRNNHEDADGIRFASNNSIRTYCRINAQLMTTHSMGIQTDIVAMGGSSGSPIIDPKSEVLGMAQDVIATMTTVDEYGMPPNLFELTKVHCMEYSDRISLRGHQSDIIADS